ncbi:MAG TPA: outer membrane protein assembly factor BamA [Burkholderiaceae bacterium]
MRPVAACVLFAGAALPGAALAVDPFQIHDIRVEGLQRTDPGSVFSVLPFRVGDTYTDDKASAAVRALFATGLFKDVRIDIQGDVVVVIVDERATIASVNFLGTKEFDKDTLTKALKDAGIGAGLPFDKAIVDRAEQEIKRQYLGHSLYGAQVVTTITPLERNRVDVTFKVSEGDVAHIRDIHIVGSKAFSESKLLGEMDLTTGGWLTWYTKSDRYSRTKLNADLEKLRSFYLNRGYLEFDITSTQVTISPDKQTISITITVHEGQPYVVTAVRLEGNFLGRRAEFENLVKVKPGAPYHGDDVTATVKAFTDLYGTYGYAFAHVEPHPEIDRKTGQVVVVLAADPGRRAYVRRVNLAGNTITRDEVIRREFRQFESAWYDGAKIKLSRDRVDRLGFFSSVDVDTNDVPGAPDQVDLTVNVVEKPTGNLTVAAGYSQTDKLSLTGSIKKENVFGSGNYLALDVSTAHTNKNLSISETDPYFTDDGISRTIDLYYRTSRPLNSIGNAYAVSTPGAAIRFGLPYSEYDTVFVGLGAEQTHIGSSSGVPDSYIIFVDKFGAYATSFPITIGWSRDQRDSGIAPTSGRYARVNTDFSLFGDVQYARFNGQVTQYVDLGNHFSLGVNAELGYGVGLNGKPYPVFKNFYGGGLGSVRVFEQGSLGRGSVDVTGAFIGGSKKFNVNNELYIPVPGAANDKSLRIFAFLDAGNVWADDEHIALGSLRASAGLGLSWTSPVGPFKLSYGYPIKAEPNDRIQKFQFQVGTAF